MLSGNQCVCGLTASTIRWWNTGERATFCTSKCWKGLRSGSLKMPSIFKAPNHKHQIPNKFQILMIKIQNGLGFRISDFEIPNLKRLGAMIPARAEVEKNIRDVTGSDISQ